MSIEAVILVLGITLPGGEFRQNIEPCHYAYCAESREQAKELRKADLRENQHDNTKRI